MAPPNFHTDFLNDTHFEVFKGSSNSNTAVLFLHGYPSDLGDKNADLAIHVNEQTNLDCFLIHYPGLGKSKGEFTFVKSLKAVYEFCNHLKNIGYTDIYFIGHSWGGFLALNATQFWNYKSKVILLSPFLHFPEGNELKELAAALYAETQEFLLPMSVDDVLAELTEMRNTCSLEHILEKIKLTSNQLVLIQAINDQETPREFAMNFVNRLPKDKIKYLELDTDHSFAANRRQLMEHLCQNLK